MPVLLHTKATRHPDGVDGLIAEHADAVVRFPAIVADAASQQVAAAYRARRPS